MRLKMQDVSTVLSLSLFLGTGRGCVGRHEWGMMGARSDAEYSNKISFCLSKGWRGMELGGAVFDGFPETFCKLKRWGIVGQQ